MSENILDISSWVNPADDNEDPDAEVGEDLAAKIQASLPDIYKYFPENPVDWDNYEVDYDFECYRDDMNSFAVACRKAGVKVKWPGDYEPGSEYSGSALNEILSDLNANRK